MIEGNLVAADSNSRSWWGRFTDFITDRAAWIWARLDALKR